MRRGGAWLGMGGRVESDLLVRLNSAHRHLLVALTILMSPIQSHSLQSSPEGLQHGLSYSILTTRLVRASVIGNEGPCASATCTGRM